MAMKPPQMNALVVKDCGKLSYAAGLQMQTAAHEEILALRESPAAGAPVGALLLLEHDPPVITVSRRPEARRHLVATPAQLEASGVEVAETDRGGDITYHGPGQLVAYPIVDLQRLKLGLHDYLRLLEQVVIEVCAQFGVMAHRDACATGVWVGGVEEHGSESRATRNRATGSGDGGDERCAGPAGGAKICAMGVRVRRWVTMHGLALNVTTNLSHFDLIVPCGLAGRSVTSLARELGEAQCPSMSAVKRSLAEALNAAAAARLRTVVDAGTTQTKEDENTHA